MENTYKEQQIDENYSMLYIADHRKLNIRYCHMCAHAGLHKQLTCERTSMVEPKACADYEPIPETDVMQRLHTILSLYGEEVKEKTPIDGR